MADGRDAADRLPGRVLDDVEWGTRQGSVEAGARRLQVHLVCTRHEQKNRVVVEQEDQRFHDRADGDTQRFSGGLGRRCRLGRGDDDAVVSARNQNVRDVGCVRVK